MEKEMSLEEIMKNANVAAGLDLDISLEQEIEVGKPKEKDVEDSEVKCKDEDKKPPMYKKPPIKISGHLQVGIDRCEKTIFVCPGKPQYFTATAINSCGGNLISIEYDGYPQHCPEEYIQGCLGYYRIIKSGLIFLPYHNLVNYNTEYYPMDILSFKAKDGCNKEIKFDVVFAYSKCVECGCKK